MRLHLIRHPKPGLAAGICYGATDIAVPEQAIEAALASLQGRLPRGVPLFTSPLQRCSELAKKLAAVLISPPPVCDGRLAEMNFGDWEMRAWNDISRAEIDAWASSMTTYRPGGGETVIEMARRVHAFHEELRSSGHDCAIVVCHAGTIRLLRACCNTPDINEIAVRAAQAPNSIGLGESVILEC